MISNFKKGEEFRQNKYGKRNSNEKWEIHNSRHRI